MTRGQIAIITKEGILTSTEFNGDMYMPTKKWAGYGRKVIDALKRVKDIADFHYEVARFNKLHHHYEDNQIVFFKPGDSGLDMKSSTYYDEWFSDYVYIKNLRKEKVVFTQYEGTQVELAPNEIGRFYFGTLKKIY